MRVLQSVYKVPPLVDFKSLYVVIIHHKSHLSVVLVLYLVKDVHEVIQHQLPVYRLLPSSQKSDREDFIQTDDQILLFRVAQRLELESFGLVVDVDMALELETFFHQKRLLSAVTFFNVLPNEVGSVTLLECQLVPQNGLGLLPPSGPLLVVHFEILFEIDLEPVHLFVPVQVMEPGVVDSFPFLL